MKYFLFPKFNCNHFLFLSYFLISVIKELIILLEKPNADIAETFNYYYIYTSSDFLSIIPVLIIKIRSRSSKIKEINIQNNSNKDKLIYKDANVENRSKKLKYLIKILCIISFMEFLAIYSKVVFYIILMKTKIIIQNFNLNSVIIFSIISQYICNRIILHYLFYRHHYISFIINIIFLIILVVIDIITIRKTNNNAIKKYYIYSGKNIIYFILFYSRCLCKNYINI